MRYWRKTLDKDPVKAGDFHININTERCKGCRLCIEFCPRKALGESADFNLKGYHPACATNSQECVNCGLCELLCPEFAVKVESGEGEAPVGKK